MVLGDDGARVGLDYFTAISARKRLSDPRSWKSVHEVRISFEHIALHKLAVFLILLEGHTLLSLSVVVSTFHRPRKNLRVSM